ncbi:MAG: GNAT family N-acetyltransferase [Proteobacteria bacterium]|nr:GNAT family N-acetyltransferase [Pseudomonadota bacterium]MBI3497303.1 GNAT family N-acetyltransferase [Pseudomonadota bacterium]
MTPTVPPDGLIDRIIASDTAYTSARVAVIGRWPGNPYGAETRSEGGTHAFAVRGVPSPWLNRAVGFGEADADKVAGAAAWFRERGVRGCFDVMPDRHGPALAQAFGQAGFMQSRFDSVSWAAPRRASPSVPIETIDSETGMETFLDAHLEAWSMPTQDRDGAKRNMQGWLGLPGWTMLLARLAGGPAGTAVLHVADGIAYIALTATRPASRRQGVQTALLQNCFNLAAEAGADIIWSRAAYLSSSHRNMLRAGLSVLCTPAFWTRSDP